METIQLTAQARDTKLASNQLRRQKLVPGVYYGKGEKALSLQFNYQDLRKVFLKAGYSSLVDLVIDGKGDKKVLIQEIQIHPLKGTIQHVDLLHVNMKEEITTEVPVELTGVAPAVKDFGGILNTVKHELEIKCLPSDIPHAIVVDISTLAELSAAIHVKDLPEVKGVTYVSDPEDVIVVVNAPRAEEEAAPAPAEAAAEGAEGAAAPAAEGEKAEEKKE